MVYVRLLEKGTSCENRLHLMRSVYEIDLGSDESIEPVHPTPKGEAYHVRVDDENTDVRALLTSLGASEIHHVQKCNDDSREWCVGVSGELTGDSAVPWACFEAERDALLHQKAPSAGSWPKKTAKKLRTWLAKRLGGAQPRDAQAPRQRRRVAGQAPEVTSLFSIPFSTSSGPCRLCFATL